MLEVQMGQGADMGTSRIDAVDVEGRARILGGLAPGEPAIALPAPPGVQTPADWPAFMQKLRQRANGIPIALKLMATGRLEEELAMAIQLGFDAVMLDGSGGGSHATAPIKQDDFGIPNIYALVRAKRLLKNTSISLVVAGGFFTPGQCLKALALPSIWAPFRYWPSPTTSLTKSSPGNRLPLWYITIHRPKTSLISARLPPVQPM
jgi:glutamate synthase domain-containing protein 2